MSLIATGISFSDVIWILLVYICMFIPMFTWGTLRRGRYSLAVEYSHICYKISTGKHLSGWFTLDQWRHRSTMTQHFCIKLALTQCKVVFVYSLLLHWYRMIQPNIILVTQYGLNIATVCRLKRLQFLERAHTRTRARANHLIHGDQISFAEELLTLLYRLYYSIKVCAKKHLLCAKFSMYKNLDFARNL